LSRWYIVQSVELGTEFVAVTGAEVIAGEVVDTAFTGVGEVGAKVVWAVGEVGTCWVLEGRSVLTGASVFAGGGVFRAGEALEGVDAGAQPAARKASAMAARCQVKGILIFMLSKRNRSGIDHVPPYGNYYSLYSGMLTFDLVSARC
jgi:hypothetical protein